MMGERERSRGGEERHIERSEAYNNRRKQKDLRMFEKSREKAIHWVTAGGLTKWQKWQGCLLMHRTEEVCWLLQPTSTLSRKMKLSLKRWTTPDRKATDISGRSEMIRGRTGHWKLKHPYLETFQHHLVGHWPGAFGLGRACHSNFIWDRFEPARS